MADAERVLDALRWFAGASGRSHGAAGNWWWVDDTLIAQKAGVPLGDLQKLLRCKRAKAQLSTLLAQPPQRQVSCTRLCYLLLRAAAFAHSRLHPLHCPPPVSRLRRAPAHEQRNVGGGIGGMKSCDTIIYTNCPTPLCLMIVM